MMRPLHVDQVWSPKYAPAGSRLPATNPAYAAAWQLSTSLAAHTATSKAVHSADSLRQLLSMQTGTVLIWQPRLPHPGIYTAPGWLPPNYPACVKLSLKTYSLECIIQLYNDWQLSFMIEPSSWHHLARFQALPPITSVNSLIMTASILLRSLQVLTCSSAASII